jgi:N-methylhydantoinase A
VLGRLGADRFLGGEMRLDVEAARRALLERVAKPLGMDATAAADGILRIAATAMSYAVKGVTTERGLDAGDFVLVAYGGAGPLQAVPLAEAVGLAEILVPASPGGCPARASHIPRRRGFLTASGSSCWLATPNLTTTICTTRSASAPA